MSVSAPKHRCPYVGVHPTADDWACGYCGWLCHRCREDRADARARLLAEQIAGQIMWAADHFAEHAS